MKKYPIGIQTFQDIRNGNYCYIDKTDLIYRMSDEGKVYFLSRPRRFGKSLLLSTLEAYFSGKKSLFKGLAIESLEKEWIQYPIFHLDFSGESYDSAKILRERLNRFLVELERLYGKQEEEHTLSSRFEGLIKRACQQTGRQVVVLVDEYDKPLLQAINDQKLDEELRNLLKAFYGVLKPSDPYLRFVFLTGVTKFSKVSIFSDLNQLKDISMSAKYNALCGITEKELIDNFQEDILTLAEKSGVDYQKMLCTLRTRYDGYHFCEDSVGIYNPFSILNVFSDMKIQDYWFQTGTPTFLMELLRRSHFDITHLEGVTMEQNDITNYRAEVDSPVPIIYQSGYLTIKGYDNIFQQYTLGYPNVEVRDGFLKFIAPLYVPPFSKSGFSVRDFTIDLMNGDAEGFMTRFKSFIAAMDYELFDNKLKERYFQTIFYIVFRLAGSYITVEQHTSNGRIDAVVQTQTHIYLFEFKLDKTAQEALAQIEAKHYADIYLMDSRPVIKIGANFDSATHQLSEWIISK